MNERICDFIQNLLVFLLALIALFLIIMPIWANS